MTYEVEFALDKETRNTLRYLPVDEAGQAAVLRGDISGSIYLRKTALAGGVAPSRLTVTVRAA